MKETYKVAVSSIFVALSLTFLYLGSLINVFEYTAIALTSTVLLIIYEECGAKYAWLTFFSIFLLNFILMPYKATALLYGLYGSYPIVKYFIESRKSKILRICLKCLFFLFSTSLAYVLLVVVLKLVSTELELPQYVDLVKYFFCLALILIFILYDKFLVVFRKFYFLRLRNKFFK